MRFTLLFTALSLTSLTVLTTPSWASEPSDPLENVNRRIFAFNSRVDDYVLEPVSKAYTHVTPKFARNGIRNVFDTLDQPSVLANTALQGDVKASAHTAARLGVNLTLGVAGTMDVASRFGINEHDEDFGQTLGKWGVAQGAYLVLPLAGPTTLRDGAGSFVDGYADPLGWNTHTISDTTRLSAGLVNGIDQRARAQNALEALDAQAIDPYVQMRSYYLSHRAQQVANTQSSLDVPDFE